MKKCKQGYYYCYKDKKCKRIPLGYRVGLGGWLRKEKEEERDETTENGNHKNGDGSGNGGSHGSSNGGSVSEGWSQKYKRSIDCNNPKGFSQKAHCQGRKKMSEEKKDHEYSMARSELKTVTNAVKRLQKKMGKKGEGDLQAWVQSKITKAADYIDTAADYVTNEETKSGDQGLRDWFGKSKSSDGKRGWVQLGGKWAGKPCARQPGQTSTPKCGSSKMAANLSDEEEERARRRKNRQDPNQPEKSGGAKPTNVKTEEMNIQEVKDKPGKGSGKKDACYNKVKSRYSVWPSAYASGALVKCRKVGAANWGNKSEEFSNWREELNLEEGQKCWPGYEKKGTKKMFGKTYNNCVKKEETELQERGDFWHPDPEKDRKLGGPGPNQRAREDGSTPAPRPKSDSKKLRPGESYYEYAKRQRSMKREQVEYVNEIHSQAHTPHEVPSKGLKKLVKKAATRIDTDADGDVDHNDKAKGELGEFIPGVGNKRLYSTTRPKTAKESFSDWRSELEFDEAIDKSKMKCNSPKAQAVGDSLTGKSHVVKACEGGKEKIIRFGQRGVKGSPKKKGESKEYASRRHRFQTRHAKNIAKGKMSAAYWANKVKW